MGVPKFYRWISERYPCLSETVKEYQIPEFDNLYLDMNGIIHNCSHPNDEDPHFRITMEKIFQDIFHYIEFLFRIIKPRKVFFMAVDGVAPRAKMNQQRGRRFRTAKEAELKEAEAVRKGEVLPKEDRFDSNCITPGTEFMAALHTALRYFVSYKISTDISWQQVTVYLSGHETPGEGEHKIMDFIRYHKSQRGYNPNTKHCLYGLDADLIMLGLCSHEPHFALLREEVKFGSQKNQKKTIVPEDTTFHLLHLTVMREYLEHEFSTLKKNMTFQFDIESVIDDWVLMGFLVGNDFIPHLPQMHIQHDALPILYRAYIEILPSLGGYINEKGILNLQRFQLYLDKLAQIDKEMFNDVSADIKYLEGKKEKDFLSDLDELMKPAEEEEEDEDSEEQIDLEFVQHKRDYYMTKMDYKSVTKEVLKEQTFEYVRAIQWNLHYYYNGIASWSWYYPHHYAPYISDVKDFADMDLTFDLARPFLPFQQLLAVLPAASKKLLPKPYQRLMVDDSSPLKSFYPEDFKTDLNGKQQDWEAVVLIPFIDEALLLSCMEPLWSDLTENERQRNSHGPHLVFSYRSKPVGSTFQIPNFPELNLNYASCVQLPQDVFHLPRPLLKKGLCLGVCLDIFVTGFPSLRHIPHTADLSKSKVRVFQHASRGENMIIRISNQEKKDMNYATSLIGKVVHVNWPHLREAKVVSACDGKVSVYQDKEMNSFLTADEKSIYRSQCKTIKERYWDRFGVDTGPIEITLQVHLFTGKRFKVDKSGVIQLEKLWLQTTNTVALQTTVEHIEVLDSNVESVTTIEDLYPIGSGCFMLGQPYYGCFGTVVKNVMEKDSAKVEVKFETPKEPNFEGVMRRAQSLSSDYYLQGFQLAKRLGVSGYLISRMTGTFFVQTNALEALTPAKMNIGLNLKFNKRNEEISGYSKRTEEGQWLYSNKAFEVMNKYMIKFPELFENIVDVLEEDMVHVDDLFPGGGGYDYMKRVKTWLEEQPCTSQSRQACGANVLDPAVVKEIEIVVDKLKTTPFVNQYSVINVKPDFLYRPHNMNGSAMPDPEAEFQLYDRVIYIRQGATVPLGYRGTIIGIHKGDPDMAYDVVFDNEFVGAVTLNCSLKRGYRVHGCALINISHGIRQGPNRANVVKQQPQKTMKSDRLYAQAVMAITKQKSNELLNERVSPEKKPQMTVLSYKGRRGERRRERIATPEEDASSTESGSLNHFNHSPDSPFVPHANTGRSAKELFLFESPTSDVGDHFKGPQSPTKSKELEEEFAQLWKELSSPKVSSQTNSNANSYGRQVSVEELFQRARSAQPASLPVVPEPKVLQVVPEPKIPQVVPPTQQFIEPMQPQYAELQLGPKGHEMKLILDALGIGFNIKHVSAGDPKLNLELCIISLSSGRSFYSSPQRSRKEATECAAEIVIKALQREDEMRCSFSSVRPSLPTPFLGQPSANGQVPSSVSLSAAASALPRLTMPTWREQLPISRQRGDGLPSNSISQQIRHPSPLKKPFSRNNMDPTTLDFQAAQNQVPPSMFNQEQFPDYRSEEGLEILKQIFSGAAQNKTFVPPFKYNPQKSFDYNCKAELADFRQRVGITSDSKEDTAKLNQLIREYKLKQNGIFVPPTVFNQQESIDHRREGELAAINLPSESQYYPSLSHETAREYKIKQSRKFVPPTIFNQQESIDHRRERELAAISLRSQSLLYPSSSHGTARGVQNQTFVPQMLNHKEPIDYRCERELATQKQHFLGLQALVSPPMFNQQRSFDSLSETDARLRDDQAVWDLPLVDPIVTPVTSMQNTIIPKQIKRTENSATPVKPKRKSRLAVKFNQESLQQP